MVITTFEMILADCPELKKIQWRCVVIDEAHRLKNRNCKLLEGLKLMALVSTFCPGSHEIRGAELAVPSGQVPLPGLRAPDRA